MNWQSALDFTEVIDSILELIPIIIQEEKSHQSLSGEYYSRLKELNLTMKNIISGEWNLQRNTTAVKDDEVHTDWKSISPAVSPLLASELTDEQAVLAAMRFTEVTGSFHYAAKVVGENHLTFIPGTYWIINSDKMKSLYPFMEVVDVD